jgi:hypothetical protein
MRVVLLARLVITLAATGLLTGCDITSSFWPDGPAPWEKVEPVYYPNRNNLLVHRFGPQVDSVEACRAWVYAEAARNGDPNLNRGDYGCGVGYKENFGSMRVYRLTVR